MNSRQAKEIPLVDFVKKLPTGSFSHRAGKEYYFFSPLRDEKTPSFSITRKGNIDVWHDKGPGVGGTIIDLVIQMKNCSVKDALAYIGEIWDGPISVQKNFRPQKQLRPEATNIKILKVESRIWSSGLLSYAQGRGIGEHLVKKWLKLITYQIRIDKEGKTEYGKKRYGLAMQNQGGGYSIRNGYEHKTTKPNTFSFIEASAEGNFKKLYVFEGQFDFLSLLAMEDKGGLEGDVLILNSTANTQKALEFLAGKPYTKIYTYLDNDRAGKEAQESFMVLETGSCSLIPMNHTYEGFNDLNEKLQKSKALEFER